MKCSRCGLRFADPMPDMETVVKGNRTLAGRVGARDSAAQYKGGQLWGEDLKSKKERGRMLDVGCTDGAFLAGVGLASSWEVEGLEVVPEQAEEARRRFGVKVSTIPLEEDECEPGRYDHIRLNNVLEHVQDPKRFLQKVYLLLKPGGTVFCSTPNGIQDGALLQTANRRGIRLNLLENHFYLYPPRTLARMFEDAGMVVRKSYCVDLKHALHDFGCLPWFRYSRENQELGFDGVPNIAGTGADSHDAEMHSIKGWDRVRDRLRRAFRIRLPAGIGIGHQQELWAHRE